eukprot:TRINITY_DN83_c0_g1_i3.p2 TRINITY_DN83_c0_g1~~TRINITY_DN83_c0_g1_i3.p2  ORF type:complete len:139 (+),score=24.08 TRINITY_DN83_c0_g1_i3:110-526(+)
MADSNFRLRGILKGHEDWVTSLATTSEVPDMLVSSSRDKTSLVWNLTKEGDNSAQGHPRKSLRGHSHYVEDVVLSSDGQFALSGSWGLFLILSEDYLFVLFSRIHSRFNLETLGLEHWSFNSPICRSHKRCSQHCFLC